MTAHRRDLLPLGAAAVLLVLGVAGWLLLPIAFGATALAANALPSMWLAALGVACGAWYVTGPTAADRLVIPALLAAIAPLAMVPLAGSSREPWVLLGLTLASLAVLPLADVLIARITTDRRVVLVLRAAAVLAVAVALAVTVAPVTVWSSTELVTQSRSSLLIVRFVAIVALLAALAVLAILASLRPRTGMTAPGRIVTMLTIAAAAVLPMITNVALLPVADWPLFASLATVAVATTVLLARVAIQPLAIAATRADAHRDEVIAASEAERSRLAQALHDGPLGDITLLVQRLDAAGDADNAAIARAIATDLRTIGNDLQLPILDDLGAGPALEWLVARVARRGGTDIQVRVEGSERPPHAVELAVYRVAQEAIVNAVKHGAGPVLVQYRATAAEADLSVDDAGPGLPESARSAARSDGRLGIVSMEQRADAIGAELSIERSPAGGTHVGLRWTGVGA
jgi:two-component system NarL family sensor kinase